MAWLWMVLLFIGSVFRDRGEFVTEGLAQRQQLVVLYRHQQRNPIPAVKNMFDCSKPSWGTGVFDKLTCVAAFCICHCDAKL